MTENKFNWKSALLGVGTGYLLARETSRNMKPVHIGGQRIHHYLLVLGSLFTENNFLQGVLTGAAIEDLPDLIDDLFPNLKNLSDNLRRRQDKFSKWN